MRGTTITPSTTNDATSANEEPAPPLLAKHLPPRRAQNEPTDTICQSAPNSANARRPRQNDKTNPIPNRIRAPASPRSKGAQSGLFWSLLATFYNCVFHRKAISNAGLYAVRRQNRPQTFFPRV